MLVSLSTGETLTIVDDATVTVRPEDPKPMGVVVAYRYAAEKLTRAAAEALRLADEHERDFGK